MPLSTRLLVGVPSKPKPKPKSKFKAKAADWASMNPFSESASPASALPPTPTSARPRTPYRSRTFPPPLSASVYGRVEGTTTTTRAPTPHSPMTTVFRRGTVPTPSTPRGSFGFGKKQRRPHVVPRRGWKGDLYDCFEPFDCSDCMLATCCPCILYASNKRRFEHLTIQGYPHPDLAATRRRAPPVQKPQQQQQVDEDGQPQGCFCSSSEQPTGRVAGAREYPRQDPSFHRHPQDHHHHPGQNHNHNHNHEHDHEHEEPSSPTPTRSWFSNLLSVPCLSHAICAPLGGGVALQAINRWTMRERYNIKGERWHDACTALWCGPCALLQEAYELKEEEEAFVLDSIDFGDEGGGGEGGGISELGP